MLVGCLSVDGCGHLGENLSIWKQLMKMLTVLQRLSPPVNFVMDEPVACARECARVRAELEAWPSVGNSDPH